MIRRRGRSGSPASFFVCGFLAVVVGVVSGCAQTVSGVAVTSALPTYATNGRPVITFDPCTVFPPAALAELGLSHIEDPILNGNNTDSDYNIHVCHFQQHSEHDRGLAINVNNLAFEGQGLVIESQNSPKVNFRWGASVQGREAATFRGPAGAEYDCAVLIRIAIGSMIFGTSFDYKLDETTCRATLNTYVDALLKYIPA